MYEQIWLILVLCVGIVTITICAVTAILGFCILTSNKSEESVSKQNQNALLGAIIGLFGALVTAVFFITALKVDIEPREVARTEAIKTAEQWIDENLAQKFASRILPGILELIRNPPAIDSDSAIPIDATNGFAQGALTDSYNIAIVNFNVNEDGIYRIDVIGQGDFDPVVTLYSLQDDGTTESIAIDDDSGEDLNARIEQVLDSNVNYQIRVEEFYNNAGEFAVNINRLSPQ